MEFFYKSVMVALLATMILVAVFGGVSRSPLVADSLASQPVNGATSTTKKIEQVTPSAPDKLKPASEQQSRQAEETSSLDNELGGVANESSRPQAVSSEILSPGTDVPTAEE